MKNAQQIKQNEEEIGNLSEKEFQIMIMKMIQNLQRARHDWTAKHRHPGVPWQQRSASTSKLLNHLPSWIKKKALIGYPEWFFKVSNGSFRKQIHNCWIKDWGNILNSRLGATCSIGWCIYIYICIYI